MIKKIDVSIDFDGNKSNSLINILNENIMIKSFYDCLNEEFEDYEIEFLDNDLNFIKFASNISLNNDIIKGITYNIKNGLFTDISGYCHKVKLDRVVQFL